MWWTSSLLPSILPPPPRGRPRLRDGIADISGLGLRLDKMYPLFYLRMYSDLAAAYGESGVWLARDHWLGSGTQERRCPSPFFDPAFYINRYPDLMMVFRNDPVGLVNHWVTSGIAEARQGSRVFDIGFYINSNPDLFAIYGPNHPAHPGKYDAFGAFGHWVNYGLNEGRPTVEGGSSLEITPGWALGTRDQAIILGTANDPSNPACTSGFNLHITPDTRPEDAGAAVEVYRRMCEGPGDHPDRGVFSEQDRNQYETDQAERNANTG
jgi:hypothetical protein